MNYLYLGLELGGRPADPTLYRDGKLNYDVIKQTALFQSGIVQVADLVRQGIKVTLMCSESNQNDCHRKHLLTDPLKDKGFQILHINKKGDLEEDNTSKSFDLFNSSAL